MSTITHHETTRAAFVALRRAADLPPGGSNLLKHEVVTIAEQLGVSTTGSRAAVTARLFGYDDPSAAPNRDFNYITKTEASTLTHRLTTGESTA